MADKMLDEWTSRPFGDPFARTCVVVDEPATREWLRDRFLLRRAPGGRRVIGNLEFRPMPEFVNDWLAAMTGEEDVRDRDPAVHPYSRGVLAWRIDAILRAYVNARHDLITAGRALRSSISALKPSDKVAFVVSAKTAEAADRLRAETESLAGFLGASGVEVLCGETLSGMPSADTALGTVALKLEGSVDAEAEKKKAQEEIAKLEGFLRTVEAKLGNETFLSKAPAAIVEQQKARKEELLADLARKRALLASLG